MYIVQSLFLVQLRVNANPNPDSAIFFTTLRIRIRFRILALPPRFKDKFLHFPFSFFFNFFIFQPVPFYIQASKFYSILTVGAKHVFEKSGIKDSVKVIKFCKFLVGTGSGNVSVLLRQIYRTCSRSAKSMRIRIRKTANVLIMECEYMHGLFTYLSV